jgi:cell division protein ZapE
LQPKLDEAQALVQKKLNKLIERLRVMTPGAYSTRLAFWRKPEPIRGLYIWGPVGRGKTMLMDQFFNGLKKTHLAKRRIHFHAFMQEVHAARAKTKSDDVIADIAEGIAAKAKLLCLDEMQVADIADAMILGRLFEALWARGVVIVTTSNQPPDGLYRDGLNRQLFLPFVARLKQQLEVIHLADGIDYRLGRLTAADLYVFPLGPKADVALGRIWDGLTDGEAGEALEIEVLARKLVVPHAAHGCARFTFDQLCRNPLAAPDYLAIARHFRAIFVEHVPVFKASERNEAKRFVLLIDTLYDAGTRLVISAEAAPEALCTTGPHKSEFLRTASRLREMQSLGWWQKAA